MNLPPLRKVKITQLEMIRDRGYDLGEEAFMLDPDTTVDAYNSYYQSRIGFMEGVVGIKKNAHPFVFAHSALYNHPDGRITLVIYIGVSDQSKKSLAKQVITNFVQMYDKIRTDLMKENDRFIGVLITPIPAQEQMVKEYDEEKRLQFFDYTDLAINVTKHRLSSPHIFLTREESEKVVKQIFEDAANKSNTNKLPIIKTDDRIARYYYARPDTICKVLVSETLAGSMVKNRTVYKVVKD